MEIGEEGVVSIRNGNGDNAPKKPQNTRPNAAALAIRTMRDDLVDAKRSMTAPAPQSAETQTTFKAPVAPPPPVGGTASGLKPVATENASEAINPLAGKPMQKQPKPSRPMPPSGRELLAEKSPQKKKRDKVLVVLIILFALTALGAAGVWAWIFLGSGNGGQGAATPTVTTSKAFNEVIPANSMLVAHYNVSDATARQSVQSAWASHVTEDPTMSGALAGDPRLFLNQSKITSFNYVLLPGDPRYYVVLEGSDAVDQFLSQYSNVQVLKYGQWRILHPFSTDLYQQELTAGTMPQSQQIITSFSEPLVMYVAGDLLSQLYDKAGSVTSSTKTMLLAVSFGVPGDANVVRVVTKGADVTPAVGVDDMSSIFASIPADAMFVRAGANLADRIPDFTKPYAYYERTGSDGFRDVGVVATIPESLRASVTLGDAAIEAALPKLFDVGQIGPQPASALTFIDSTYANTPLRYVNVDGPQKALDYAISGGQLLTATSREGMFADIDAATGTAVQTLNDTVFGHLQALTSSLGTNRAFGELTQPSLKKLLPGGAEVASLPFGVAFEVTADKSALSGVIALPEVSASPSVSPSPLASPVPLSSPTATPAAQ